MKKFVLALTTVAAGVCLSATALADTYSFTDISASQYSWCAPQIEEMYKAGYVNGYEDNTYRPDNQVTKLEGIALFSRVMGSNDSANSQLLDIAHEQYDSSIVQSSLSWGQDEIVFMMYKGALTNADLVTYINGTAKNQAMTRGEAAVIITKAMGGNVSSSSDTSSLDYTDVKEIPSNILPYVKYVSDEGIMNGMDDGSFDTNGTVTRSQIAVMLARVVEKCDYSFENIRVSAVDTDAQTITILNANSDEQTYEGEDIPKLYIRGDAAQLEDIPNNVAAVGQYSGDTLISLDALSSEPDEEVTGVYTGYSMVGNIMQIKVRVGNSQNAGTYTCIENVPITYQDQPATIRSFSNGDTVTLELSGGVVQAIRGEEKAIEISNATVSDLSIDGSDLVMTIESGNEDYDGKSYPVSSNVRVTKNGKDDDMSSIYVGDKVTLTLEYGVITKVTATSSVSTVSGTLKSLTISSEPSITITVDGKDKTYVIPPECVITINEKDGEIYDFRVGDSLVLTVESQTVTKIKCSTSIVSTSGKVYGTVNAVNTSYGFISVTTEDSDIPITIFCRDNSTTFINEKGSSLKMSSIEIGDTVECRGATTNGAFVASLVIVTPTAE